jgi:two-component system sensor histidine kinase QseC
LTWKLVGGLAALAAISVGAFCWAFGRSLVDEFDRAQIASARALVSLVEVERGGEIEFEFVEETMPMFAPSPKAEYFDLRLASGAPLARSRSLGEAIELPREFGTIDDPRFYDVRLPDGRAGRAVGVRFVAPHEIDDKATEAVAPSDFDLPTVELVYARGRESLDATLAAAGLAIVGLALLLPIGMTLFVRSAVKRGLEPLERMAGEAAAFDAARLNDRFSTEARPEELAPIARRMNELLDRLEAAFERERRFSGDVAHELRTPLAELRALIEVGIERNGASNGLFRDALDIAECMERIVAALLALVRCGGGQLAVNIEPIDLVECARETLRPYEAEMAAKRIDVAMTGADRATIESDRTLLAAVVRNLVSNAVSHSPEGGSIRVEIGPEGEGATLAIRNAAIDLTPEDVANFDRPFWRKEAARTSGAHVGLGLALVRAYCELLGIEWRAAMPEAGIFETTLVFRPCDPTRESARRTRIATRG